MPRLPLVRGVTLCRSELTGRVYAVTAWRDLGNGRIEAVRKTDVTADFDKLAGRPPRAS